MSIAPLASINSKILGEGSASLPAVTLKDGSKVQTGTVATMLVNVANYNAIVSSATPDEVAKKQIEGELAASVPTLVKASHHVLEES
ncbi:hypothetical protein HK101_003134, partial [Irineochytrium annulatum]